MIFQKRISEKNEVDKNPTLNLKRKKKKRRLRGFSSEGKKMIAAKKERLCVYVQVVVESGHLQTSR